MAKNPSLYGMQHLNIFTVGLMGLMHACRVNSAKRLRHLFEQIDSDHDGKFDASDFRFFLHKSSMRLEKMTQVSRTPPCCEPHEHQCFCADGNSKSVVLQTQSCRLDTFTQQSFSECTVMG